ncbi:PadR family transcriptional regulator [Isoptericola rhizosphaerae]|uniref:PadR family transcriptional regulator n=1 Tax=Isoptericola rhizosphaerae TaxID=3377837 RepID=UPI00383A6256
MAHVILGLLLIAPQSLYDLVKSFEAGVSLFYSASSGSIKRALDVLLDRGAIEVASVDAGARGRKVYRVTETGRREFDAWMTGELTGPDIETAALSRLFFLGLLPSQDRVPVLEGIVRRLEAELAQFRGLDAQLDGVEIPAGLEDVATHQRATLGYGIASVHHALGWFREHLDRERARGQAER